MPSDAEVAEHREIQSAAKAVLADLPATLTPTTRSNQSPSGRIAACVRAASLRPGTTCPAYVLLGSRSCLDLGRDYRPADERVGETNL